VWAAGGVGAMKALVTGAGGFTGSHLVEHLARSGHQVRALVRPGTDPTPPAGVPVEYIEADLGDGTPLDAATRGADVVVHAAAVYRREGIPRELFRRVNVEGTRRLLEAAKRAGVRRFIHVSTVGVQGNITDPPATESAPYAPGDHYQASKRDAEILALDFFRSEGLPGTVVRPTGIYGPGDLRFLKLFRAIARGTFVMLGRGHTLYQLCYVDDLVRGIVLAAERDAAVGEVFTIGGAEYLPIRELVARIAQTLGRPVPRLRMPVAPVRAAAFLCEAACRPLGVEPPIYRRRVDFFTKHRAFDISKARRLLGYEPRVPLDDGLRRTADWYRARGLLQ
jgi:nucleoside-diphosphate-sugar epimerase